MKTGIVWREGLAYTMGEGDATERVFHYCTTDYNDVHIEIIPTCVISGNADYGNEDETSYIFTMGLIDGICIGYSSRRYPSVEKAREAAKKMADTYRRCTIKEDDNGESEGPGEE